MASSNPWSARELLANTHKHARASNVDIRLFRTGDTVTLIIADDGIGFDPAILDRCLADGHIGLASLGGRVDAMGGSMRLESVPGSGTQTTVTMPAAAD